MIEEEESSKEGMTSVISSVMTSHQYDDEDLYDDGYYYDEDFDFYPDLDHMPGDDDKAVHGQDRVEPPAVCCGYGLCPDDRGSASTCVIGNPAGAPFCDLEGLD